MDTTIVLTLVVAIISAVIAASSYCLWRSFPDSRHEKTYLRALQGFTFLTVIYLVAALLIICGAPWYVTTLFIIIGIALILML